MSATASSVAAPAAPASRTKVKAKGGRRWAWILIASLVLGAAAGGGWWWWQARNAAHADDRKSASLRLPAQYHALEPPFVVNLADQDAARYLQADVQLVTRDPLTLAAFQAHAPAIRNRLLLLFGQQSAQQIGQRSGKERLQQAARDEVRVLLKAEGAPDKVEAVIFTSLVTQ